MVPETQNEDTANMIAFGMVGKLKSKPEDRDKLLAILTLAAEIMGKLETCHQYIVFEDADDAGTVWVTELWESQAAHDESLTDPLVRELIGQAMPLLVDQPDGARLIPVAGI